MVCVGIDVAKDKHDCCILDSDGMVRADCFTIPNNMDNQRSFCRCCLRCHCSSSLMMVSSICFGV